MLKRVALFGAILSMQVGCAMVAGGKPSLAVVKDEVKATKAVDGIVIPAVTGIDATGNTGKALLASAIGAYGKRSRPMMAAKAIIGSVGAPDGFPEALTARYQIGFAKLVEEFAKKGFKGPKPESLTLASEESGLAVPTSLAAAKDLVGKITGEAKAILELGEAMQAGDNARMMTAFDNSQAAMSALNSFSSFLFKEIDCTYILTTHVVGNEKAWDAGKQVFFTAALVNLETGKLRYFGTVEAKKGIIPLPFMAQVTAMAQQLYDQIAEKDPLPKAKGKSDKTAYLHLGGETSH